MKATLADTSFIEDEIETIRERNDQMTDKFLRGASAGVGFAENTRGRMNSAMGVGQAGSMLDNARMSGFEQAADAGRRNEMNSLQAITSLTGMKANLEQFNAGVQNDANATNFMARRAGASGIFDALGAGMLSYATGRRDNARFNEMKTMNQNNFDAFNNMYQNYLNNLNSPSAPPSGQGTMYPWK